jgi:myo-inositol-1(or 4)-monophosphatase
MPDYVEAAARIARAAGAILREGYGQTLAVEHKGAIDLVTDFDRRSEALILRELRQAFPGHGSHAEESGRAAGSEYEWLVDPLDGTTNFAHGFPVFAVSLALIYRDQLLAGVVYDPLRDELYAAEAGQGATLNGARLTVSAVAGLGQALLATGFPYDVATNPVNNADEFQRFQLRTQGVRRAGSAALDCAWVAAGRLDGYWEFRINPWDIGAGALMVREAGGRATDGEGSEDFLGRELAVVSNGLIHQQMLDVLHDRA